MPVRHHYHHHFHRHCLIFQLLQLWHYTVSDALMSSQSSVSHNLMNSIHEQSDGMRNYALPLQPLFEKLRSERSYKDLLQESEIKYESELSEVFGG
jgi:hypothetical protein